MDAVEAERVVESLRKGIPPDGYVRHFTVGRKSEIGQLTARLGQQRHGALLLKANYGSGKTHLLRFIRESALREGYAVSLVTLNAQSAVKFNRMDQILGAIWRGIEVPSAPGRKGVRPFLDLICQKIEEGKADADEDDLWPQLTNNWRWDYSDTLESPALFIAVRAWATGEAAIHDLVEDWLLHPWNYEAQRKRLYFELVEKLRGYFRDPRPEWKFYATTEGVFNFRLQSYAQSWGALRDLHKLACAAGLKGLIILFDEFEDVIYNIRNISHQESAFWNLFQFYSNKQFGGMSFFAVTPNFVEKCKTLLLNKGYWDYDYSRFEKLATFQMSPLQVDELEALALKIMEAHGTAYGWEPASVMRITQLRTLVKETASVQIEDRARHTIREVVKALDQLIEEV
jgi:BREX system ATP-binding protein BrxC/D